MNVKFDIKLSKSQQEVYDKVMQDEYKYITVAFSRQSGKTVLMTVLVIQWLFGDNNTIAYVCRNFTLAKKLYREIVRIFPKEYVRTANGSDFYIESVFGSSLTFYSSEQGSSLRGQTFSHMVCDEFAFHKQQQPDGSHLWNDILSPTLKARGKKCIFVSTPLGKNNIFHEMYIRGLSDDYPNYTSILKTVYDDGFVTAEEIEEIRKSIPELSFRQEFLCEFIDDALTFFRGFDKCFKNIITKEGRQWIGVDLSADGSDATIITHIYDGGGADQDVITGTTDDKCKQIANIIDSSPSLVAAQVEVNGIGAPMLEMIRKYSRRKNHIRPFTTTNASKEEIISDLAVAIENGQLSFEHENKGLYAELSTFVVKVSKGAKLTFGAIEGMHDDRVMSLAIAYNTMRKNKLPASLAFTPSSLNIIR